MPLPALCVSPAGQKRNEGRKGPGGQASAWRLAWPKECHEDRTTQVFFLREMTAQVVGPRRDQLDL